MPAWLTLRIGLYIVGALAIIGALWWAYSAIRAKPEAEARLGRNQVEAAQESGKDAVNTIGAAGDREAASETMTRDNERSIRDAEGADAPVTDAARNAGLRSLCRRPSYSNDPRCVQFANPR